MEDNIVLLYGDCNAEQIVRIGLSGHIILYAFTIVVAIR